MDAKWLEDFLAVAECRSFTLAAKLRNTSQSGLSRRIQSLEQWMGASLVDRQAHPFRLTEAGTRFMPYAINLRSALQAARQLCAAPAETAPAPAPVALAVAEGLEAGMLALLLARLQDEGIDACVRVTVRDFASAVQALRDGEADLWLAPQHAQLPLMLDAAEFESASVARDRLSPVARAAAGRLQPHVLPGTCMEPVPFIEYSGAGDYAQLAGMRIRAVAQRIHVRPVCAADSLHSLRALVRQGAGVAFLPESMVLDDLRQGDLVPVGRRWSVPLDIRLIRPRGRASEAARRMWDGLTRPHAPALPAPMADLYAVA